MKVPDINQQVPVYSLENDPVIGGKLFNMLQFEGMLTHYSELLVPHRKDYYLLVYTRRGNSRHWVDMTPYTTKNNTFYLLGPGQLTVKEESGPMWGTAIAFNNEFLALQENASLNKLPVIQNLQNAHELILAAEDIVFVEEVLEKTYREYSTQGQWRQQMTSAYVTVLLTYLSRLYSRQFEHNSLSGDKQLLRKYHTAIEKHFRESYQVGQYAALLHVSAGHLSEIVKAQSGKPAIAHIHARLVLEAKRMLSHSGQSLKEIAFDLGFTDASYFSRFFKREAGMSPAEYRAGIREIYQ